MSLQPGTTLGPYSVTALIGKGSMGEVYRARDARLDRRVAVKIFPDYEDRATRWEGKGTDMNLNAFAVVGAVLVALALIGVLIFGVAIG